MLCLQGQEAGCEDLCAYMSYWASLPGWGSRTIGPGRFVDYPSPLKSSQTKSSLSAPRLSMAVTNQVLYCPEIVFPTVNAKLANHLKNKVT